MLGDVVGGNMIRTLAVTMTLAVLWPAVPAFAQVDLSGWWTRRSQVDNGYSREPVDMLGIPVSDDGRAKALSYDLAALSATGSKRQTCGRPIEGLAECRRRLQNDALAPVVEKEPEAAGDLCADVSRELRIREGACLVFGEHRVRPLEREAAELLADRVEGNLLAASQEIERIALLQPGGRLGADAVAELVADNARYDVFELASAAFLGNAPRALRILEGLRGEGREPPLILWALLNDLRALSRVLQHDPDDRNLDAVFRADRLRDFDRGGA